MKFRIHKRAVLSMLVTVALGGVVVADAVAQSSRSEERRSRQSKESKSQNLYPDATREAPDVKASSRMSSKLQRLVKDYEAEKYDDAKALADEIINDPKANEYDKSFAAQIASQSAYHQDDYEATKRYLQQAIESNGLDNNGHYQSMFMLAQLQLQDDDYEQALATIDRFLSETRSTKPEELVVKGNILYRMERYNDAIPVLQQAIEGSSEPRKEWTQLLMASYAEADRPNEAVALAEQIAAKNPNDKNAQMNLASIYMQADQMDKAVAALEKVRNSGQLTDDREYRQLYAAYLNMDGREKDAIAVINEGLEKGILKPDYQAYVALAQAYYFSDQYGPAIEAYKKAAPLAPNGETYLNLARVLWQEDRVPEAKEAAKQALDKGGLKKPEDAQRILGLK